ncbi:hypothetical protein A9K55_001863 [Cordyceps militaris]|uniref:Uncharacterized protein n=1 Tax=Cordyceps militaris TaxID=73501 RepID=A0A2H4SRH6_CORMI|nr:hypothetical protein A9K55_001863 [Cordyceps militaris]
MQVMQWMPSSELRPSGAWGGGEEGEVAVSASLAVFSSGSVFPKRATWTLETGWMVLVRPSSV